MIRAMLALFASVALAGSAYAQAYGMAPIPGDPGPEIRGSVDFKPKPGAVIPAGLTFYDHDKKPVMIQELMGGKPTVLVLVYYRCPKLCNEVLIGLLNSLRSDVMTRNGYSAGNQFNVIVVGIDPRESPDMARQRRELFLREYDGRPFDQPGVWFLTPSRGQGTVITEAEANVKALADSVGFHFVYDNKIKQYIHGSGILVLSPDGQVSRFLAGIDFPAQDLRLAIIEAGQGKVGSWTDRATLLCFAYDHTSGHYRFTMRWLAAASVPFVFLVLGVAVYTGRRVRREKAALAAATDQSRTGG
ncbi:MAG TPA: SCO family protein [Fimbriiglobus sp.]|jgi:protein SCO1/2